MEDQILKLIQDIGNNGENIGPEQELLESGILDSLAFITLLEEIAVRWRIEIQPTQVPPEEWKTVRSIARMLEKKMVEKTS
ncbi:MAG: phosphopantetheine-binding protein [Oscillospiraceae bacterium]|mgnify:FL=1|jgi:acyl carrier protein|nr:phosphopantetheine-binding protein [Oscillospiraceae bacterium]MDD7041265.1 phosphopantetheine-binding protein [Oscillospiraceae bacterium]MDY2611538.1 phosphopantetheine-binding protein [Oscillospiraceae bacterium]